MSFLGFYLPYPAEREILVFKEKLFVSGLFLLGAAKLRVIPLVSPNLGIKICLVASVHRKIAHLPPTFFFSYSPQHSMKEI
jgi:hypothetical protein